MSKIFGSDNPRKMPEFLFSGAEKVDYKTAVSANHKLQNCSVCPRYWYVDMHFRCSQCEGSFVFNASEQKKWYEKYGFWIESVPKSCQPCRKKARELKALRLKYDAMIGPAIQSTDLSIKKKLAETIDALYEIGGELPQRINENRRRLGIQIMNFSKNFPENSKK